MSTITAPATTTEPLHHHRFTVEQYLRMSETAILGPDDRTELLDGWIVDRMTANSPHTDAVALLIRWFVRHIPDDCLVHCQSPIRLAASVPEPDLAVVRAPGGRPLGRHPVPADVLLVIEVSDSTLATDRGPKLRLYAQARLPIYWIVNVVESQIEVCTQPRAGRSPTYRRRQDFGRGASVPVMIEGREIAALPVNELFPG